MRDEVPQSGCGKCMFTMKGMHIGFNKSLINVLRLVEIFIKEERERLHL